MSTMCISLKSMSLSGLADREHPPHRCPQLGRNTGRLKKTNCGKWRVMNVSWRRCMFSTIGVTVARMVKLRTKIEKNVGRPRLSWRFRLCFSLTYINAEMRLYRVDVIYCRTAVKKWTCLRLTSSSDSYWLRRFCSFSRWWVFCAAPAVLPSNEIISDIGVRSPVRTWSILGPNEGRRCQTRSKVCLEQCNARSVEAGIRFLAFGAMRPCEVCGLCGAGKADQSCGSHRLRPNLALVVDRKDGDNGPRQGEPRLELRSRVMAWLPCPCRYTLSLPLLSFWSILPSYHHIFAYVFL